MPKPSTNLRFEPATETDVMPLTVVMVRAFDDDSQRYRGTPEPHPPGYETGEWLRDWLSKGIVYKIVKDEDIIGGFIIIANLPKENWNHLASVFVDLPYQNQAIGSRTLQFIEHTSPARRWQTMTQAWALRNHHFYEKNGYTKVKEFYGEQRDHVVYVYQKEMP
jgi:GNAT superfamily N-acetyltransferase